MLVTTPYFAYPIGKVTIKQLIETSTHIVVGYKTSSVVKKVSDFGDSEETTFDIQNSLTSSSIDRYIKISHASSNMRCPTPPYFKDNSALLVFLIWDKDNKEFNVNSMSYGVVNVDRDDNRIISYVKLYLVIQKMLNDTNRLQAKIDWLISTIESPKLFEDAITDLFYTTSQDDIYMSQYPREYGTKINEGQFLAIKSHCKTFTNRMKDNWRFKKFCSTQKIPLQLHTWSSQRVKKELDDYLDDLGDGWDDFGGL